MKVLPAAISVAFASSLSLIGCVERDAIAEPPTQQISFSHTEHPPFTLEVTAVERGGDLELTATIDLHEPLPVPLELTVTLPNGRTLVTGQAHERLMRPARGDRMVRAFRIRGTGHAPFTITAKQELGEVMGAQATRTWPPPAPEVVDTPWAPIPPAAHGAVVISEAIVVAGSVGP